MTTPVANIDNTTLLALTGNLDIGDVADPALRLTYFQYLNVYIQTITTAFNLFIANGSVGSANLADLSVLTAKIADLAVTTGKIAELAVTTAKLNDMSVTLAKMAAASVGTTQLVDLSVTRPKIAAGAVGAAQLDATLLTDYGDIAVQAEFDRRGLNVLKYSNLVVGGDWTTAIQTAFDFANSSGQTLVISPPNAIYNTSSSLIVPAGLTIDFNGSQILTINAISGPAFVLNGSNITIKNMVITQSGHNYSAAAGVAGISLKTSVNVNNITFQNVKADGFEYGFNINPNDGFLATDITIENCSTNYAEVAGFNLANAKNISVLNHEARYNRMDGLKTTRNVTDLHITNGAFSYNVNPTTTYADGIDLYAGGNNATLTNVVCEYNGGAGFHIQTGELNDPAYQTPVYAVIKNIILTGCIARNNTGNGFDTVNQVTVSATTPYASKVIFNACVSEANSYGWQIRGRYITLSNCDVTNNLHHGIQVTNSIFVGINYCQVIQNGLILAATYAGIYIVGSSHVKINGGTVNGADSDILQKEDGSALTKYHKYAIWIDDAAVDSSQILVNETTLINFTGTRGVYVTNFNLIANVDKSVVIRVGDIGSNPVNNQIGYYGSHIYKSGRRYIKKTNLNSVVWDLELQSVYGSQNLTANASTTVFNIAHGLGVAPVRYALQAKTALGSSGYYVTVDATNIIITYASAPSAGTVTFQWEASA